MPLVISALSRMQIIAVVTRRMTVIIITCRYVHVSQCYRVCFRESDAQSDYSLFEALRDSIYAEVATLISQNESRPHFLVSTFLIWMPKHGMKCDF